MCTAAAGLGRPHVPVEVALLRSSPAVRDPRSGSDLTSARPAGVNMIACARPGTRVIMPRSHTVRIASVAPLPRSPGVHHNEATEWPPSLRSPSLGMVAKRATPNSRMTRTARSPLAPVGQLPLGCDARTRDSSRLYRGWSQRKRRRARATRLCFGRSRPRGLRSAISGCSPETAAT